MKYLITNYKNKEEKQEMLSSGEVGFITASIKDITLVKVGDTITHEKNKDIT